MSRETMRRIITDNFKMRACRVTRQPKLTENQKKQRLSFAYRVRREFRKEDHRRILFCDEKYFSEEDVFKRQNERVDAVDRQDADQHSGIREKSKYSKTIIVCFGACRNSLRAPIIFKPGQILSHENSISVVLPHAQFEGR